jgi:ribosome-associated heat shock protein Hsp15
MDGMVGKAMSETEKIRLDKWLWAARFFKTRSLAKDAVESGKVRYNKQRCKVSKEVEIGAVLEIPQGYDEMEVTIIALSSQRRGAPEARLLYQETVDSLNRREAESVRRKMLKDVLPISTERPTKKQRRDQMRFKLENDL